MIYVTRKEHFNAAHKVWQPAWSEEKNMAVFGKCANKNWHGHNYTLFVTVRGEVDASTGFLINLKDLSAIIDTHVLEKLDHRNINLEVGFMAGKLASTENLAIGIWNEISEPIAALGATLHCIKLYETENNFVEYFGG